MLNQLRGSNTGSQGLKQKEKKKKEEEREDWLQVSSDYS